MIVDADGRGRVAWALQDIKTGHMHLATICEEEEQAYALCRARDDHQPHRGHCKVVAITITVELAVKGRR